MGKLHEVLAVEAGTIATAEKLLGETAEKFNKHTEFFTGHIRTLHRVNDSEADKAIERAAKAVKALPTNVPETLAYIFPYLDKALSVKLQKHLANQIAKADVELDGKVVMKDVPVDFLLDLEKLLPRWRAVFVTAPTLDPSKDWVEERKYVYKTKDPAVTAQTEKTFYPVVLAPATDKHPAQVKEASKDIVVGNFEVITFSGGITSQQKADLIALCDKLLGEVKKARMRANSVEVPNVKAEVTQIFANVLK